MSRTTNKSNWRDGLRRRSPRISAADAWKEIQPKPFSSDKQSEQEALGGDQGGPSRTRTRVKRKFGESAFNSVSKIHKQVWKGRDNLQGEDHSNDFVRWTSGGELENNNGNHKHDDDRAIPIPNGKLPEKRILELILDILQRRDTYEIFAEPVDPDEVEDYYEIIKEPMDFATTRAKLHEGMYQNLEQFEHDVFLISENAMHFNSTATIYFRQARAIHELAKKVFHVLRTNPENFVSEFSGTRRRSMRKALSVAKDSRHLNVKVSNVRSDVSSKKRVCSPSRPSPLTRTTKGNPGCTGVTSHNESRYYDSFTGSRDGGKFSFVDVDHRSTYQRWRSSLHNENDTVGSKSLMLMNQGDISYRDSLMSFVKDLGLIAEMVAKRKLLGQHEKIPTNHTPNTNGWIQFQRYQVPSACDTLQSKSGSFDAISTTESGKFPGFIPASRPFPKADNIIDLTDAEDGEEANGRNQREKTNIGAKSAAERGLNVHCISKLDKVSQTRKSTENRKGSCSFNSFAGDLNTSIHRSNLMCTKSTTITVDAGKPDDSVLPVILALENSHSIVQELKSRNKKSSVPATWTPQTSDPSSQINDATHTLGTCQSAAAITQNDRACSPIQTKQPLELKKQNDRACSPIQTKQPLELKKPVPSVSQFCFDLPFLKAQLNQMKTWGLDECSKSRFSRGSDMKKASTSLEKRGLNRTVNCMQQGESSKSTSFLNHQSWPPVDNSDTNLALQL